MSREAWAVFHTLAFCANLYLGFQRGWKLNIFAAGIGFALLVELLLR